MQTSLFEYHLPQNLIAQYPLPKRDSCRLLVLHRENGQIEDRYFSDILEYLKDGDVLVANNTQVIPARIFGKKETGGKVEIFLLKQLEQDEWEATVKPGRGLSVDCNILLDNKIRVVVKEVCEDGKRRIKFSKPTKEFLDGIGKIPLPPYIKREATKADSSAYQTIYAKIAGAVAAPTAGLHFTKEILEKINEKGIAFHEITLHVGLGTFRPVHAENIEDHKMEKEWAEILPNTANAINQVKKREGRVWAVGTTSVRTLEAFYENENVQAGQKLTDLFIYPPYKFNVVDGLLTNFHLPSSTLLALTCAFGGYENVMQAYKHAVTEQYRFYSYGDAMLIL